MLPLSLAPGPEHLEGMFTRRKVQCIGLQETRSKRQGHDVFGSFHVFSSPATARGCNGMQLWFARTLHTSQGPIQFGHEHFRILHGDERRLIVRLRHPSLKLLLIVLHAPSEDDFEVRATMVDYHVQFDSFWYGILDMVRHV